MVLWNVKFTFSSSICLQFHLNITVLGNSSFARVVVTLAHFETRDFLKKEVFNDVDALADDFIFFVKDLERL